VRGGQLRPSVRMKGERHGPWQDIWFVFFIGKHIWAVVLNGCGGGEGLQRIEC
ncbi:hypothetical protein L195_g020531, partial [Trifolium pratense]